MENVISIMISQFIVMFIIMILGFILFKAKLIDSLGISQCSSLIIYVASPATMLLSFMVESSPERMKKILVCIALTILFIILFTAIGRILFKDKRLFTQFSFVLGNTGFLGIPIVKSVLGNECVIYMTIYAAIMTFWVWTIGIYEISQDKKQIQIKKIFTNPAVIAVFIGFILMFTGIKLPEILHNTLNTIGNINTGLVMIVLGAYLAQCDFKKVLTTGETYLTSAFKLLISPLIGLVIFHFFPESLSDVTLTVLIALACPIGTMLAMFAQRFDKDFQYGAGLVGLTTFLSLLTMPLMVYLSQIF